MSLLENILGLALTLTLISLVKLFFSQKKRG